MVVNIGGTQSYFDASVAEKMVDLDASTNSTSTVWINHGIKLCKAWKLYLF